MALKLGIDVGFGFIFWSGYTKCWIGGKYEIEIWETGLLAFSKIEIRTLEADRKGAKAVEWHLVEEMVGGRGACVINLSFLRIPSYPPLLAFTEYYIFHFPNLHDKI